MTTPRASYGGGYGSYYSSSASFPDTPIYDSLVAERGTPQIAPIRVPSPYDSNGYNSFGGGSNLPALPAALPALPAGPSAPAQHPQQQPAQNGYPGAAGGYQQQPTAYLPQQAAAPRPAAPRPGGYPNAGGYPGQQQSPSGYEAARPVPPRPVPPRQAPGGHPEEQYQRRNLGPGYYQG